MPEKLLEQRIMELNAGGGTPPAASEDTGKRTYSIEEIQQILDILQLVYEKQIAFAGSVR